MTLNGLFYTVYAYDNPTFVSGLVSCLVSINCVNTDEYAALGNDLVCVHNGFPLSDVGLVRIATALEIYNVNLN